MIHHSIVMKSPSVKDKKNVLSLNLWSAGDYLHNTSGCGNSSLFNLSVSNDWSTQGDESFLCECVGSGYPDLIRLPVGSYESGDYALKCNIYNPTQEFAISFFNGTLQSRITIPKSEEITRVTATLPGVDNTNYLSIRLICNTGDKFYIDDVSITHVL